MLKIITPVRYSSILTGLLFSAIFFLAACEQKVAEALPSVPPTPEAAQQVQLTELKGAHILVFSKTSGWRHDSIPAGINALQKMANAENFSLVATEDAALFTDAELRKFNALVFLNTSLDVLDENQQLAMERYIQAGGGFVGVHAAADTEWEGDWFWYRNLVGAVFKNHPQDPSNVQDARVNFTQKDSPFNTEHSSGFSLKDEWYNYKDFYEFIQVVATVDETTYQGGEHGAHHPIAWFHDYDGGRSFYTGLGHSIETYSDPHFLQLIKAGLGYVIGLNHLGTVQPTLDYTHARPENNRFIKKVLVANLDEPVKLAFFPNGDALIALRPGKLARVDYKSGDLSDAGAIPGVAFISHLELGLIGVALDPEFKTNNFIYTAFSVQDASNQLFIRLARFVWNKNQLDPATETLILEYPIDTNCCHTGGDLEFDADGNLFMSTGDNTNPHEQDGYAPLDFRPGLEKNDALRGAGNTMDLRGKVLRIKLAADGSYTIPAGNLFADATQGRPEIYVMGTRNAYSITYDDAAKTLFYGDVGPDATNDSELKGSRGYDEINRVTQAGNFGWPLVIGKNHPYRKFNYVTQETGDYVDVNKPINYSPHNTGAKELPPAQPAFIAYPYGTSDEFPELGTGGRTALVADVFHANEYPASQHRYPAYYNNKLFIMDFMRAWIKVVSFDEQGRIHKIEPFAPQINYALPIDARFAPDGTLYVLEYGMSWFTGNPDARLTRVEYVGAGNRPPSAQIQLNKHQAGAGALIEASAAESTDLDGDKISFEWRLNCVKPACTSTLLGNTETITFTPKARGTYQLQLKVVDAHGAITQSYADLAIGNEPPQISLSSTENTSFYWPETHSLRYSIEINDKEDGHLDQPVSEKNPMISLRYASGIKAQGHQALSLIQQGEALVTANNCLGCHKLNEKSIGPAYKDVALKYANDPKALSYLMHKIANGGSGVWGEMNMPGFSGLAEDDRKALASYVLSLGDAEPSSLPLSGSLSLSEHSFSTKNATETSPFAALEDYTLQVVFSDKGALAIAPIQVEREFTLLPARIALSRLIKAESLPKGVESERLADMDTLKFSATGDWLSVNLQAVDLTTIKTIKVGVWSKGVTQSWTLEVRTEDAQGTLLATATLENTEFDSYQRLALPLPPTQGARSISIRVKSQTPAASFLHLGDIGFEK